MDLLSIEQVLSRWASREPLVRRVWTFGSRVRGEYRDDSDIDVAIELDLQALQPGDPTGGLHTWVVCCGSWRSELERELDIWLDLQWYGTEATPSIRHAVHECSRLVYRKAESA